MLARWSGLVRRGVSLPPPAVLSLIGIALLAQLSSTWLPTRDGAAYLSIARSIAAGDGALRFGSSHLHFFPGYPALVAPAFFFSDQPFIWLSFLHWLFAVAFLGGCYVWFRRRLPEHALLLTALAALNVSVLYYFRRTLSEAAFMPLLIWTAVFMDRALAERGAAAKYLLAATAAALCLCATRLAGAALACGFLWMTAIKLRHREFTRAQTLLYALLGAGLPLAAAFYLVYYDRTMASFGATGASYFDELTRRATPLHEQILNGMRLRIQEIGRLLVPGAFKAYGGWWNPIMLVYLPVAAAVAAGWWRLARRGPCALLCAVPFYVALYVIWPHDQGTRFMTPLVPVLWLALITTLRELRWRERIVALLPWLLAASLATSVIYFVADRLEARKLAPYFSLTARMATVVPRGAAVGFIDPARSYSAHTFASVCALRFDRRCAAITAPDGSNLAVEYIAVLGAPAMVEGFGPLLRDDSLTVLRRISETDKPRELQHEPRSP